MRCLGDVACFPEPRLLLAFAAASAVDATVTVYKFFPHCS